ncbi:hypothetical protein [Dyadobacter sp. CY343]|uniref:hypothetical protein n=1 Tax=Dyadobacter sp. CY343 TaxID=2907299 RepID=UPI001F47A464|nr:hypothetical protein [Dyadobacter sp. CY343]MCE7060007.1 hypothetical protein [Dyadobacter sp. CY343]
MFKNVHVCRHAKDLFFLLLAVFFTNVAGAQDQTQEPPSYPKANYDPLQPPPDNKFGVLYNWHHRRILVPTLHHEMQSVWLTAYLPYIENEYDPGELAVPFGNYYTTAFALCSPRNPDIGLFAPIEITAVGEPGDLAIGQEFPFASVIPPGAPQLTYNGLFDKLHNLNEQEDPSSAYPILSKHGPSALHAAQSFTSFMQHFFGHGGIDKDGLIPIKIVLRKSEPSFPFNSKEIYFTVESTGGLPLTSQSGIAYQIGFRLADSVTPSLIGDGNEAFTLKTGFGSIMSLSFTNWEDPTAKFSNPKWIPKPELGVLPTNQYGIPFNDPKPHGLPSTYKGKFWYNGPDRIVQNITVLNYWFYLLNTQKSGHIDDNDEKGFFLTEPLVTNDKHATYELALKILYDAVVSGKIYPNTTLPDFRELTLQAAVKNNHPVGSDVYKRIMTAWYAVNVGPAPYTSNPNCAVTAQAESWFNGELSFAAMETSLTPDTQSAKALQLKDCMAPGTIETLEYDEQDVTTPIVFMNKNPLESKIYGKTLDPLKSKAAVSIHKFTIEARNWFRDKFGHNGVDGNGKVYIFNILADPEFPDTDLASLSNFANFYYNYNKKSACRDEVSRTYSLAVSLFKNFPSPTLNNFNEDNRIWKAGIANIFALAIKRDYERALQNANANNIWTLYEETADPELIMNFTNPKLSGQPAKLFGENWKPGKIKNNSGFLNLFYYLLVHGTEDENGQDVGHTNNEPGSKTYFVNPVKEDLVLKVIFEASRSIDINASLEQFRQATMTTLHDLDPIHYHAKSKEHIAFYDAWAAVLGLPEYASTLAHSPEDGTSVYPWPVKVGVEVEYPLYESYRLFEVSKSSTFNENEFPVHRFVSNASPDHQTSMSYGEVNLEAEQTYYVRSHLANGPESRQHCSTTDDPAFCESLLNKKKWTLTYELHTESVLAPVSMSPLNNKLVAAWATPFNWGSVPGARGYDIHVIDHTGTVSEQDVAIDIAFDEDNSSNPAHTELALSKDTPYSYAIAARQRLGSENAVHVLPQGSIILLSEEEKEAFPNVYGQWTETRNFKTDIPKIKLHSPADGTHVPLFGEEIMVRAKKEFLPRADYYQYSFREPLYEDKALEIDSSFAHYPIGIQGLIGLEDKKSYEWTFIQRKKATPPFILQEEEGASPGWFSFIVDKDLAPKPEVEHIDCIKAGSQLALHWKEVPGAQSYRVKGTNAATQGVVANFQTGFTGANINGASEFPNKYVFTVEAGVMGGNGEWIFGPQFVGDYAVLPPSPFNLSPNNVDGVKLGPNNSVVLSWELPAGITTVQLMAKVDGAPSKLVDQPITGTSFTLNNLDFNSPIFWTVTPLAENSCMAEKITGFFNTEKEPMEFDLGFELRVDNNDPHITGGFYHYLITVQRPDGQTGFSGIGTVDADTWLQVGFVPGEGQLINGNELNGQLLDQAGDYVIQLEILDMAQCDGCADPKAHPAITVSGVEYKRKIGEDDWSFSREFHPEPSNPVFPSRTIGAKKIIKFHYEFPN